MKFPFPSARQEFLILEVFSDRTEAVRVRLGKDGNIFAEPVAGRFPWGRMPGVAGHLRRAALIVSASPSLAATCSVPVEMVRREAPEKPITALELENFFSQAVARAFGAAREEASRELGADELHVVLVQNRAVDFTVNGRRVMDPTGFPARRVSAVLDLTFTIRPVFEAWKEYFGNPANFFFTEAARAELHALRRAHGLPARVVFFSPSRTLFFSRESGPDGPLMKRIAVPWRLTALTEKISASFLVEAPGAERIYHMFVTGDVSDRAKRFIGKVIQPAASSLFSAFKKLRIKGEVFVETPLPLPFGLPHRRGGILMREPDAAALLGKLGFSIEPATAGLFGSSLFRRLAPFLEFYYTDTGFQINRWLQRRVHWLGQ